ncbi:hypothetical protein [Vibrio sp.]|uniref:hypothetical protein n=1 Tax=Vibrio sp. TaxID=678 RepID=UPI0037A267A8
MLKNAEVRVLVMLKNAKKNTLAMTDLTRRLNVNAGIRVEEKNQILESLKELGYITVECKKIPAMRRTPTLITLTGEGKKIVKGIESGEIEFDDN